MSADTKILTLKLEENGIEVYTTMPYSKLSDIKSGFGIDVKDLLLEQLEIELEEKKTLREERIESTMENCKKEIDELLKSVKTDTKEEVQIYLDALMSRLNEITVS